jgi:hypothetical protein
MMLHLELKELSLLGADLACLGFSTEELAAALKPADNGGLTDEDEIPDLPEAAGRRRREAMRVDAGEIKAPGPNYVANRPCSLPRLGGGSLQNGQSERRRKNGNHGLGAHGDGQQA